MLNAISSFLMLLCSVIGLSYVDQVGSPILISLSGMYSRLSNVISLEFLIDKQSTVMLLVIAASLFIHSFFALKENIVKYGCHIVLIFLGAFSNNLITFMYFYILTDLISLFEKSNIVDKKEKLKEVVYGFGFNWLLLIASNFYVLDKFGNTSTNSILEAMKGNFAALLLLIPMISKVYLLPFEKKFQTQKFINYISSTVIVFAFLSKLSVLVQFEIDRFVFDIIITALALINALLGYLHYKNERGILHIGASAIGSALILISYGENYYSLIAFCSAILSLMALSYWRNVSHTKVKISLPLKVVAFIACVGVVGAPLMTGFESKVHLLFKSKDTLFVAQILIAFLQTIAIFRFFDFKTESNSEKAISNKSILYLISFIGFVFLQLSVVYSASFSGGFLNDFIWAEKRYWLNNFLNFQNENHIVTIELVLAGVLPFLVGLIYSGLMFQQGFTSSEKASLKFKWITVPLRNDLYLSVLKGKIFGNLLDGFLYLISGIEKITKHISLVKLNFVTGFISYLPSKFEIKFFDKYFYRSFSLPFLKLSSVFRKIEQLDSNVFMILATTLLVIFIFVVLGGIQ